MSRVQAIFIYTHTYMNIERPKRITHTMNDEIIEVWGYFPTVECLTKMFPVSMYYLRGNVQNRMMKEI